MSPASQSFRFRESRRLLREAPVRLSVSGEAGELVARTRDIAVGGMFVSTPEIRPVGTGAAFVLELGPDKAADTVQGEASVVWVREAPGGADQPAGMGMRFTRLEPAGEERLAMLFSESPDEGAGLGVAAEAAPEAVEESIEGEESIEDDGAPIEDDAAPVEDEEEPQEVAAAPMENEEESQEVAAEAMEDDAAPSEEVAPPETAAAEETAAMEETARPEESSSGEGGVSGTRADLFGDLASDDDDWMKRESDRPAWVWPTVAGVILVGLLLFFLSGPLMRLVGVGGGPEEEAAPAAPSFDLPAPVEDGAAGAPAPAGAPVDDPPADPLEDAVPSEDAAPVEDAPPPAPVSPAEPPRAAPSPAEPPPARPAAEPRQPAPVEDPPEAARPSRPAAPPPAPAPVRSTPPAAPPANATALRSITASVQDGRTVVEIAGNAPFERHHVMPLDAPPRLLVRLIGVQRDYDASAVRAPRLGGVRTGVHGQGATRNLHVVIDLAEPDVVATVERRGDRVVVTLSD